MKNMALYIIEGVINTKSLKKQSKYKYVRLYGNKKILDVIKLPARLFK